MKYYDWLEDSIITILKSLLLHGCSVYFIEVRVDTREWSVDYAVSGILASLVEFLEIVFITVKSDRVYFLLAVRSIFVRGLDKSDSLVLTRTQDYFSDVRVKFISCVQHISSAVFDLLIDVDSFWFFTPARAFYSSLLSHLYTEFSDEVDRISVVGNVSYLGHFNNNPPVEFSFKELNINFHYKDLESILISSSPLSEISEFLLLRIYAIYLLYHGLDHKRLSFLFRDELFAEFLCFYFENNIDRIISFVRNKYPGDFLLIDIGALRAKYYASAALLLRSSGSSHLYLDYFLNGNYSEGDNS